MTFSILLVDLDLRLNKVGTNSIKFDNLHAFEIWVIHWEHLLQSINLHHVLKTLRYNISFCVCLTVCYHCDSQIIIIKRSVVSGFVYRIYRACSSWQLFHESMEKAKRVLECNQYPPNFYDLIIKDSLNTILRKCQQTEHPSEENTMTKKSPLMIQCRGKCSEEYARALHRCSAPCIIIMTIRKLRTTMPSLKPPVEKMIRMSDNQADTFKPALENTLGIQDQ